MKSAFHPEAKAEFLSAIDYYNAAEPGLGLEFAGEIESAIALVEAFPLSWTEVDYGIRRCLVRRFPFALLYAVEKDLVMIYAVMHTHRDPDCWKERI